MGNKAVDVWGLVAQSGTESTVEKKARKDVEQGRVMTFGRNGEGDELELDMMPIRVEDNVTAWLTSSH